MKISNVIYLSLALVVSACGTTLLIPNETDVARVSDKFSGYTLSELSEGKTLYEENCKKCHGLKKPNKYTEEQWNKIVPVMAKKAKIDAQQEESIRRYVITMSGADRKPAK